MHEGFIRVFENLHKLRDVSSLEAWMRKTMIYTALNFNRQELPLATTGRIDDCSDDDYTSGDEIISRLDAEIVLNAIQKLPDSYRMAINLCEIEGYTFEEAAKMMKVKEASVRSALVRGKKALATIFKERY
ncbi:MAG: RNA polymerase sigma factor [Bacteroidales bacterium]|nr:RNA polymerase sigma factor [Bacteroidales bacterium]